MNLFELLPNDLTIYICKDFIGIKEKAYLNIATEKYHNFTKLRYLHSDDKIKMINKIKVWIKSEFIGGLIIINSDFLENKFDNYLYSFKGKFKYFTTRKYKLLHSDDNDLIEFFNHSYYKHKLILENKQQNYKNTFKYKISQPNVKILLTLCWSIIFHSLSIYFTKCKFIFEFLTTTAFLGLLLGMYKIEGDYDIIINLFVIKYITENERSLYVIIIKIALVLILTYFMFN